MMNQLVNSIDQHHHIKSLSERSNPKLNHTGQITKRIFIKSAPAKKQVHLNKLRRQWLNKIQLVH